MTDTGGAASGRVILVVEDSDEHYESVLRAFGKAGVLSPVRRCADGDDALDYLHRRGAYAGAGAAPRPALVLLDLNLPGTDGRDVLAQVKADDELRATPVVVMTTSSNPADVRLCYRLGSCGYVIKPLRFADFLGAVEGLKRYWLETVALPEQ